MFFKGVKEKYITRTKWNGNAKLGKGKICYDSLGRLVLIAHVNGSCTIGEILVLVSI